MRLTMNSTLGALIRARRVLAVPLLCVVCLVGVQAAGAGGRATLGRVSIAANTDDELQAVSCTGPRSCTAVGYSVAIGFTGLEERWDGSRWRLLGRPLRNASLTAVSCASDAACMAVGADGYESVAAFWNGRKWSREPPPSFSTFERVSCGSRRFCVAVSTIYGGCGDSCAPDTAWVNIWNGTRWSVAKIPYPANSYDTSLSGVSCTSAMACTAVGYWDYGGGCGISSPCSTLPLVERWDGSRWSLERIRAGQASGIGSNAVSCVSARFCRAIVSGPRNTAIATWNGSRWSLQRVPTLPSLTWDSISCTTATSCVASGIFPNLQQSLLLNLHRGVWSARQAPKLAGWTNVNVSGVACGSVSFCVGVGSVVDNHATLALVEQFDHGSWTAHIGANLG
jgi:hypothetical protein